MGEGTSEIQNSHSAEGRCENFLSSMSWSLACDICQMPQSLAFGWQQCPHWKASRQLHAKTQREIESFTQHSRCCVWGLKNPEGQRHTKFCEARLSTPLSDPRNRNHKSLAIGNHNFEVASFFRRNRSKIAVSQSQKSHWAKKIAAIQNHTLVVATYSGGFPDPCGASETL